MKNYSLIILALLLLGTPAHAIKQDRHVIVDTLCNCSKQQFQSVVDKFFFEFQTDPQQLFTWAYADTSTDEKTSNGKNAIDLHYGPTTYNAITREGDQAFDIYVLGNNLFPNRHLGTICYGNRMCATYSGSLLESADMLFKLDSIAPQQTAVHYEVNFKFGKFFSIFITDKNWISIGKLRFEKILSNLIEYAEGKE